MPTLWAAAFGALCLVVATPARAWVESEVRSQLATVDVDRAGAAVVTEDLTLAVRGGPFPGFELSGVDLDAEPMPGASVSSVSSSKSELPATPLLLDKHDDGTLRIEVDRDKGLRTGVFLFHLQYRTHLLERQLIRREGSDVEVRWVGPRFTQGIDSARVVFRLPAAPKPPSLPDENTSTGRIDGADALGGVFIGNLHRLADKDELDIVRPHVSRGEPVLWRVLVSRKAFDAFGDASSAPRLHQPPHGEHGLSVPKAMPQQRLGWWLCALGAALAYALAVTGKWRLFSAACFARGAAPHALLDLPIGPRAAASGSLLAAAFVASAWFDQASLGAAFLVLSMALAAQYAVPAKLPLRGPGQWLLLSDADAFAPSRKALPGRFLDAGTPLGFLVFTLSGAFFVVGAWLLGKHAPYQALLLLLASPCVLPLFFTGRAAELPADLATRPRRSLARLAKRLRRGPGLKVLPWARIPDGAREPDELRLLVQVPAAARGLWGIEIGVEYAPGLAGSNAALFVVVRAREGSEAVSALPRAVTWTRGRKADERAAVLRPRFPTHAACAELVRELAEQLRETSPGAGRVRVGERAKPEKPAKPAIARSKRARLRPQASAVPSSRAVALVE